MLEQGTIIAGYRVDARLGRGGMASVYQATQLSLNRVVALKLFTPMVGGDISLQERFEREGELQAKIDHPNIVAVYDTGKSDYGSYIAMRLVRGPNLKELVGGRALHPERTLGVLLPVAGALDAAHAAGLIHRDIKPQNILVDEGGEAFLADFGLTRAQGDRSLTKTGQFVGTLDYVAPEQIQGHPPTASSDLYSFAAVLFECLTGAVPYPKANEPAVIYSHVNDPPPRVTSAAPGLPPALDEVIAKAMAKSAAERHRTAVEMLEEAQRALEDRPLRSPPPRTQPSDPKVSERPLRQRTEADSPLPTVSQRSATEVDGELDAAEAPTTRLGGRRMPRIAALVVAAAIALGAGAFFGRSGGGAVEPAAANIASVGALEMRFPNGWERAAEAPSVPGLKLREPLVLRPERTQKATTALSAGVTAATGPTLLPGPLLRRLKGSAPRGDPVQLGSVQAYRYRRLRLRGFRRALAVYVVPSTEGVATAACTAPGGDPTGFLTRCENVASSLALVRGKAYDLGSDPAYAAQLKRGIGSLNRRLQTASRRLGSARTREGQTAAARAVAAVYARAASSLRNARTSPEIADANDRIVRALASGQATYDRLAAGARANSRKRYNAARERASRVDAAVRRTLTQLDKRL